MTSTFHHHINLTTVPPPDHPTTTTTTMLGLHNIILIGPPQNQPTPSPFSSHDHHNIHHHSYNNNLNDSTTFWGLKKCQESSSTKDVEDDDNSCMKVCKDCGNRAKKECTFRRCRTCCKSRGYDCETHVRSTWVPTAKRREKKLTVAGGAGDCGGSGGSSGSSSSGVKRPRVVVSEQNVTATASSTSINAATSFSFGTGSCYQDASFKKSLPGQVKAPAVFRCIRVTAINDGEAEVAYVATVNICGHVFKGFLYDHGIDEKKLFPCVSKMHLETSGGNRDSSSPVIDPSNAFAASAS